MIVCLGSVGGRERKKERMRERTKEGKKRRKYWENEEKEDEKDKNKQKETSCGSGLTVFTPGRKPPSEATSVGCSAPGVLRVKWIPLKPSAAAIADSASRICVTAIAGQYRRWA